MENEVDLRKYTDILLKRWWVPVCIMVIAGLVAGLIGYLAPPNYQAKASVLITRLSTEIQIAPEYTTSHEADVASQRVALVALVKSTDVANKVIEQMGDALNVNEQEPEYLLELIQVSERGDYIEISCNSTDPQKASDIANSWVEAYENFVNNLYSGILLSQEDVQAQLAISLTEYEAAQTAWETFTSDNLTNELAQNIADKELLIGVKSLRDQIATNPTSTASIAANNLAVILLQASAFTTLPAPNELSLSELAALDTSLDDIDDLISTLETRSETTPGTSTSELYDEILELQGQLEEEIGTREELRSAKEIAWDTYTTLSITTAELQVSSLVKNAVVRVASTALVPKSPVDPRRVMNITIALVLGLLVGIFIVFVIEYYKKNDTNNTEEEEKSEAN